MNPDTRFPVITLDQMWEIWIRLPSIAAGYWGDPYLSFRVDLEGRSLSPGAWQYLQMGDLRFLSRERQKLFMRRMKYMLIVQGRNNTTQDVDQYVELDFVANAE